MAAILRSVIVDALKYRLVVRSTEYRGEWLKYAVLTITATAAHVSALHASTWLRDVFADRTCAPSGISHACDCRDSGL